jgi:hypothetical protein
MQQSRITFPTFVLEPRSMLERITDFLSHPDLIFGCVRFHYFSSIHTLGESARSATTTRVRFAVLRAEWTGISKTLHTVSHAD